VEPLTGLHSNIRLLALPTIIRLGWKLMEMPNTLAYYDTATIMSVKSFIVQGPGCDGYDLPSAILHLNGIDQY
jgi:hypothetical protein